MNPRKALSAVFLIATNRLTPDTQTSLSPSISRAVEFCQVLIYLAIGHFMCVLHIGGNRSLIFRAWRDVLGRSEAR